MTTFQVDAQILLQMKDSDRYDSDSQLVLQILAPESLSRANSSEVIDHLNL